MQRRVYWVCAVVFFALTTAAIAQTPSAPTPVTKYNGIYAFMSLTKVKETYTDTVGRLKPCGDLPRPTSLIVANGRARFNRQEGMVGTRGELELRNVSPAPVGHAGFMPGWDVLTSGRIDENGTARAGWSDYDCSYDLIWRKVQNASFPTPSAQFDGTYAFVSSTKANESYMNRMTGQTGQCPEVGAGTLTISRGEAHLQVYEGTVGSHGELAMIRLIPDVGGVIGTIGKDRVVTARKTIGNCSYETIWRKESK